MLWFILHLLFLIITIAATCAGNLPIIKTCGFENYAIREIFFLLTKQLS